MIYDNWMSYIKDDVKITKVVMPGAHNAGSRGMNAFACCQDGDLAAQISHGVRHFCIRVKTKNGKVVMSHGVSTGELLSTALSGLRDSINKHDGEFFIFDLREYYPQSIGPLKFHSEADPAEIDRLLEKYIEPSKYALWDFEKISDVTMGDIRSSGKKYMIINYQAAYKYSVNCESIFPWDSKIHGFKVEKFVKTIPSYFDLNSTDGIFWFQTQLTPNVGTEVGLKTPKKLDKMLRPHFGELIDIIENNPLYLEKANVISGDFMSEDFSKAKRIIALNALKGNVRDEVKDEFLSLLK
ncbi:MAG: hypothetical protein K6F09_02110 [Clostridiales bacterium]|nr:hypothetical protein [Clostridiales bacterium]